MDISNTVTDTKTRLNLIRELALFSETPEDILILFTHCFHDVCFPANAPIVNENEIVDCVYIIVLGEAEVSCTDKLSKKPSTNILAVLRSGESIGLSNIGFFSTSGARTATVKAITPMLLLRLEISLFNQFLIANDGILEHMKKTSDHLLKLRLIKEIDPFSNINHAALFEIADHLKEVNVSSGDVIFRQGDASNECYVISQGSVSINIINVKGEAVHFSLKRGGIFGEIALLTGSKRSGTAKATSNCKLFVITRNEFNSISQQSEEMSTHLFKTLMTRHKPVICQGVTIHTRTDSHGTEVIILKNQNLGTYFKISEEGLFIWHLINGDRTIMDLAIEVFFKYGLISTDDISTMMLRMMNTGFVEKPPLMMDIKMNRFPLWKRMIIKISDIMQYTYSIQNVDHSLTWLYQKVGYLFFTKTAHILMFLFTTIGFAVFFSLLQSTHQVLATTQDAWLYLVWMTPAAMLTIPLHELAHALTTKAYGRQVHRMGVGWFWLGPIAFTDTSDMWLSERGPRIAVNLAGIYVNFFISGILAIISWFCMGAFPHVAVFLWLVALSSYLLAFYNLDPILELDGYYVIMDLFEVPNLRFQSVDWLVNHAKETLLHPSLIKKYYPEITYLVVSIGFTFIYAVTSLLVFTYVFAGVLPEKVGGFKVIDFKWIIFIAVLCLSFSGIYLKMKQQINLNKE